MTFRYAVRVDKPYEGIQPDSQSLDHCFGTRPGGLGVFDSVRGGGHYCLCDCGLAAPPPPEDLRVGIHEASFDWPGKSWDGPSDTLQPLGDPFTPGTCFFEVVARGTYLDADGIEVFFEVQGGAQFELTP